MYNPARFKSNNQNEAYELMDRFPFATVVSVSEGNPFISHLPLTPEIIDGKIQLIGHLARANPHHKLMLGTQVTAIFHGPHSYITPMWYSKNDVPTWNYSAVHVIGQVELIEETNGVIECLKKLSSHVERHYSSGWDFFIPDDLVGNSLSKAIVGFKINVTEIEFKKKLSQNRSPNDRAGVLKGLESRGDENSQLVLNEMLKLYDRNGESLRTDK